MACMRWKKVHGNLSNSEVPSKNMRRPTLTCFSQSTALILGRTTHHHASNQVNNTWLLNLHNAKNLMDLSSIWTNVPNHSSRCCHATVLQPLSKILWVIGGHRRSWWHYGLSISRGTHYRSVENQIRQTETSQRACHRTFRKEPLCQGSKVGTWSTAKGADKSNWDV